VFNIGLNYLLIKYLDLSVEGAAKLLILTKVIIILQCLHLTFFNPLPEAIFCFKKESFLSSEYGVISKLI